MIKISYSVRPYIKGSTGQVGIKVRWNHSKCEVSFFTNVWADPTKWNSELLRAKTGTIHQVRGRTFSYNEINSAIAEYHEEIENIFYECGMNNSVPTVDELKQMVNFGLGRRTGGGGDNVYIERKTRIPSLMMRS